MLNLCSKLQFAKMPIGNMDKNYNANYNSTHIKLQILLSKVGPKKYRKKLAPVGSISNFTVDCMYNIER